MKKTLETNQAKKKTLINHQVPKLQIDQIYNLRGKLDHQLSDRSDRKQAISRNLPTHEDASECSVNTTGRNPPTKFKVESLKLVTQSSKSLRQETKEETKSCVSEIQQLKAQVKQGALVLSQISLNQIPRALQTGEFYDVVILNISNNLIQELDDAFCMRLINLVSLDVQNNKIKSISKNIKLMQQLKVLSLDKNQLTSLQPELFSLKQLEELTLSENRLVELPDKLDALDAVKILNLADNQIKNLPQSLGMMKSLQNLFLHGNNFTSFHCNFVNLRHLEEFSLEWFLYAKPPKPRLAIKSQNPQIFTSLANLCLLLKKHNMQECCVVTFLENYSDNIFDVNHIDNRLRTPLHNAAAKGDIGVLVGLLNSKETDPNILDKDQCTPLCLAIREEHFEAAQILLEVQNVQVNLGGGIYGSPLHLAVVRLEIWLIQALIQKGADVNKTDSDNKTPVHFVMNLFSKNPQKCAFIAELLLINKAQVNLKDCDNWTPLHTAVRKGQVKGVKTIIKLNRKICQEQRLEQFDLNAVGGVHQWTSLHLACHGGHLEIVRDLVEAGADIFQRNKNNQLPRHCAKGNYILTKFVKMCEQKPRFVSYTIKNQFQLIRGQQIHKPRQEQKTHLQMPLDQVMQGRQYSQFVLTLRQLKKNKPFSTHIDQLPKITQPDDQLDLSSLQSLSSSEEPQTGQKPDIGPQLIFDPINQTKHSDAEDKFNLFYQRDILIKQAENGQNLVFEKLQALQILQKNSQLDVFKFAIEPILKSGQLSQQIREKIVQLELIRTIGSSKHQDLVKMLQKLLTNSSATLTLEVQNCISDAIQELKFANQIKQKDMIRPGNDQSQKLAQYTPVSNKQVPEAKPRSQMFPKANYLSAQKNSPKLKIKTDELNQTKVKQHKIPTTAAQGKLRQYMSQH